MTDSLATILLQASDRELDATMKSHIEKWAEPPTAIQVLEVLDHCIHGALASGFVVSVLQTVYAQRIKAEGTTHAELEKLATWRAAS